jgi:capsular polysaccharide biosynthesis protein
MPVVARIQLLNQLRRFPGVYAGLRSVWRAAKRLLWQILRSLSPRNPQFGPAKGTFSTLALLTAGKLEGRVITPACANPDATPKPLRELAPLGQANSGSWPVFWTRHRQARLVGSSLVLMDENKRICKEASYAPYSLGTEPAYDFLRLPPPTRLAGNWTSIVSQMTGLGFCHWFMDGLPRLAILKEFPGDTRILVPAPLQAYQQDTLDWLGLKGRYYPTFERHLLVEDFYFSSPTTMTGCYDPGLAPFLRQHFLGRADKLFDSPRRFYIRRVGVSRGVVNEAEVMEFFRNKGWAIVDTQELTMAQQIQLFARAEALCTVHGAALTNLLWCQPGCRVLELLASNFLNGVYEGVAGYVGVQHRFKVYPGDAAFRIRVSISDLEREYPFLAG